MLVAFLLLSSIGSRYLLSEEKVNHMHSYEHMPENGL